MEKHTELQKAKARSVSDTSEASSLYQYLPFWQTPIAQQQLATLPVNVQEKVRHMLSSVTTLFFEVCDSSSKAKEWLNEHILAMLIQPPQAIAIAETNASIFEAKDESSLTVSYLGDYTYDSEFLPQRTEQPQPGMHNAHELNQTPLSPTEMLRDSVYYEQFNREAIQVLTENVKNRELAHPKVNWWEFWQPNDSNQPVKQYLYTAQEKITEVISATTTLIAGIWQTDNKSLNALDNTNIPLYTPIQPTTLIDTNVADSFNTNQEIKSETDYRVISYTDILSFEETSEIIEDNLMKRDNLNEEEFVVSDFEPDSIVPKLFRPG